MGLRGWTSVALWVASVGLPACAHALASAATTVSTGPPFMPQVPPETTYEPIYDRAYDVSSARGGAINEEAALAVRDLHSFELADFLLVGTIDGSLHARDRQTGVELWSIVGAEPLVQVTTNASVADVSGLNDDLTWIVEPLGDGTLYYFSPATDLQRLPVSIKQLVLESPFAIHNDDKVYTGSRHSQLFMINATDGRVIRSYGNNRRGSNTPEELGNNSNHRHGKYLDDFSYTEGTFMIGRTDYFLEIHSQDSSWNVTYSVWGPNNMDQDLTMQHVDSLDGLYVTPVHDRSILALSKRSKSNPARWVGSVPSMVVAVFDVLRKASPSPLADGTSSYDDLMVLLPQPQFQSDFLADNSPFGTYVEKSQGQWFALSGRHFPSLVSSAPLAKWCRAGGRDLTVNNKVQLYDLIAGVHPHSSGADGNPSEDNGSASIPASYIHGQYSVNSAERKVPVIAGPSMPLGIEAGPGLLSPPRPDPYATMYTLPGPPPHNTWYRLMGRVVENVLTILLLVSMLGVLSWMGVLPQLEDVAHTFYLAISRRKPNSVPAAKVTFDETSITENATDNTNKKEEEEKKHEDEDQSPKKRKRGSRGGRRGKRESKSEAEDEAGATNDSSEEPAEVGRSNGLKEAQLVTSESGPSQSESKNLASSPLTLSDQVIGYGSQGTVVYKGEFENRAVAVKRMVLTFYDLASQEVRLLQESDDHPNVIRYYCKHQSEQFLYIALELCPGSLEDVIEKPELQTLAQDANPVNMLRQMASGLKHLHSLQIVHRDIKPQNILVAPPKKRARKAGDSNEVDVYDSLRMVISDFGLCKKLENEQSSFRPTTAQPAGTAGWTAPEMRRNVDTSLPSNRLTRAVDIFSLGCVYYYVLSNGKHPFGPNTKRESNIEEYKYSLEALDDTTLVGNVEARHLIERMIARDPADRPEAWQILEHPYFWSAQKKLDFLLKVSDWIETDGRAKTPDLVDELERSAELVVGDDWHNRLDAKLVENMNSYRKYHGDRISDLLRVMRNKAHHYNELPPELQPRMPLPEGFLNYFLRRFPYLLMTTYEFAKRQLTEQVSMKAFV